MSKIEQLIQELCPGGVIYSKLGEVCRTKTPPAKLKTSDYQDIGLYPIIDQGQSVYAGYTDDERYLLPDAEYVLYGDHTCIIKYHKGSFAQGADGLKILIPIGQNVKYIYYALSAYNLTSTEYKRHWAQAKEIEIPLPPLPIQQEIVRILDTFTEAQANLEQELELRKKQYEYYRYQLLTFDENVPSKKMAEICELKAGKAISASELSDNADFHHPYPCYGGNGIRGYIHKTSHKGDFPIIGRQGALCGCINWADGNFYATEHAVVVTPLAGNNTRFLYHLFVHADLNQYKSQGAQPGLSVAKLNELTYRVPEIEKQQEIVSILDKFESTIQTIEEELALRKKQYEYYREKLLTFN